MKINNSIVKKLVIYFLLLNIFTVIVVGSYSYYRAKDALVERTFDQLISLRIEKKNRIERFFNDRIIDVNLVSKSADVKNILTFIKEENRNYNTPFNVYAEYDKFLRKHFLTGNYYERFYVVNTDGYSVSFSVSEKDSTLQSYSSVDKLLISNLWNKIFNKPEIIIDDYKLDTITN